MIFLKECQFGDKEILPSNFNVMESLFQFQKKAFHSLYLITNLMYKQALMSIMKGNFVKYLEIKKKQLKKLNKMMVKYSY
jgi:hypothetical protein